MRFLRPGWRGLVQAISANTAETASSPSAFDRASRGAGRLAALDISGGPTFSRLSTVIISAVPTSQRSVHFPLFISSAATSSWPSQQAGTQLGNKLPGYLQLNCSRTASLHNQVARLSSPAGQSQAALYPTPRDCRLACRSWRTQVGSACRNHATQATRPRGKLRQPRPQLGQRRLGDQALYLLALVVGMIGLTYAAVPLYRMFCQATGFGGTVQQGETVESKLRARQSARDEKLEAAAAAREITVTFAANVVDGLPWKFAPTQRAVTITPGQSTLAFYTAHNKSNHDITGVSTYNVAPQQAGAYFNKIQCFCFEEQRLRAGEKVDMPVFFYLDPEFATDVRMKGINQLTLSYTFFKVDDEDYDAAELQAQLENQGKSFHGMPAPARA